MKNAEQYLKDNSLNITTGLFFTCKDYDYIIEIEDTAITINKGRINREETLTKKDIVTRIYDLLNLYKKNNLTDLKIDQIEEIINKNPFILRKEKLEKLKIFSRKEKLEKLDGL